MTRCCFDFFVNKLCSAVGMHERMWVFAFNVDLYAFLRMMIAEESC